MILPFFIVRKTNFDEFMKPQRFIANEARRHFEMGGLQRIFTENAYNHDSEKSNPVKNCERSDFERVGGGAIYDKLYKTNDNTDNSGRYLICFSDETMNYVLNGVSATEIPRTTVGYYILEC